MYIKLSAPISFCTSSLVKLCDVSCSYLHFESINLSSYLIHFFPRSFRFLSLPPSSTQSLTESSYVNIPTIAFCWGLVCMCTGFISNFGSLVSLRLLLGFFEGCLFPSMTLLLANWYKREELGLRYAYLFIASALSGAFGGLLAFGILHMDGVAGMSGWRWYDSIPSLQR